MCGCSWVEILKLLLDSAFAYIVCCASAAENSNRTRLEESRIYIYIYIAQGQIGRFSFTCCALCRVCESDRGAYIEDGLGRHCNQSAKCSNHARFDERSLGRLIAIGSFSKSVAHAESPHRVFLSRSTTSTPVYIRSRSISGHLCVRLGS